MLFIVRSYLEHKIQGLQVWQTKSDAIIVHDPVPANCIYRVFFQNRGRILFERLSTPRPAPRVTLRGRCQSQQPQPQQQHFESASTGVWKQTRSPSVKIKEEENMVDETDNQGLTGTRKLERNTEHTVQEQPTFEIDLRTEGVPQDAIFEDEEQMREINDKLEKLNSGSCSKSIRDDLKEDHMIFSEESSRGFKRWETWNCSNLDRLQSLCSVILAWDTYLGECGVCLCPDEQTINRTKARFQY